jgi:hypothetical protein
MLQKESIIGEVNNMGIMRAIREHLITKKKYNKLMIKYEGAKEDIERLIIQRDTDRRIYKKRAEIWEQTLKDQEEEIIRLKKRRRNVGNSKV